MVTIRLRSMVWFVTGAMLATAVTLMFVNAWRVDAAPGDSDATFVPITACRLIDTRPAPDRVGPTATLGAGDTQTVQATGTNGKCTIPAEAVGLSMNVTALNSTAAVGSFLTFWPSGALPLAASLNPTPGQPPVPNAVTVPLSGAGAFNVYNESGTVDIVIDVNGYYTNTSLTELADGADALADRVAALEAAEPFSEIGFQATVEPLSAVAQPVVDVPVTARVDGRVTLSYSTYTGNGIPDAENACAIYPSGVPIPVGELPPGTPGYTYWETPNTVGDEGFMSGTGSFAIDGGTTITYSLVCQALGGSGYVGSRTITAIFTPTP